MNDTEPKNDFSARIFLEDPLISAFYLAKEFRSYYESIRHTRGVTIIKSRLMRSKNSCLLP